MTNVARPGNPAPLPPQTILIESRAPRRRWLTWLLLLVLCVSLLTNLSLFAAFRDYVSDGKAPREMFHSGELSSDDKIAVIAVNGTIMPPFTERILKVIQKVEEDEDVKGVLLTVDSPGGLVADSHQIYHRLKQLQEKKPVYVAMSRIAASGGYYVAMGAGPKGRIFAEPTTWTGSIGVIIPRYDISKLADQFGVRSEPLTTGPYKDSLSPFKELSADEKALWEVIMDDAFLRFKQVIVEGREPIDEQKIDRLATGQIFTASQALEEGLIDEIGFEDDAIAALQKSLGLADVRVVKYQHPFSLADLLLGSAQLQEPVDPLRTLLEAGVPRPMYFCGRQAGFMR